MEASVNWSSNNVLLVGRKVYNTVVHHGHDMLGSGKLWEVGRHIMVRHFDLALAFLIPHSSSAPHSASFSLIPTIPRYVPNVDISLISSRGTPITDSSHSSFHIRQFLTMGSKKSSSILLFSDLPPF